MAYPSNPERVTKPEHLAANHAFPTKQEVTVVSQSPDKLGSAISPNEEHKGEKRGPLTRHDSLASIDSLESNPAKFSDDEDLDPFK